MPSAPAGRCCAGAGPARCSSGSSPWPSASRRASRRCSSARAIDVLQAPLYGTDDVRADPQLRRARCPGTGSSLIPVAGGLAVGLILPLHRRRARALRRRRDRGRGAARRPGRGRRGPRLGRRLADHPVAPAARPGARGRWCTWRRVIATWVCDRIDADGITGRDLLGCAVAAAVSASFNAPIAGALFALEVVLRHFAVHAFAPIVIASVAGTVINRLEFGDVTEFTLLGPRILEFYVELPAFLLLGLVCGAGGGGADARRSSGPTHVASRIQRRAAAAARRCARRCAGALLGGIAILFPHIIGVGYETTSAALTGRADPGARRWSSPWSRRRRWRSPWAGAWAAASSRPR